MMQKEADIKKEKRAAIDNSRSIGTGKVAEDKVKRNIRMKMEGMKMRKKGSN